MVEDNMTQMLDVITKSLCIALMMAGLHDLEVKAADVLNAYVMACNGEKIWMVLGPEFWDNTGKSAIIVRALYKLQNASASFMECLAQCINA